MMEMYAPWITCRMGKKLNLLAKDDKAYYIIEAGKNLDYAMEEWLEQQGMSEALLKELNLPFVYIPKTALRGVAISGSEAGEWVCLYLKSEKKKLMLELDYDAEWMKRFFEGVPKFTAPADTGREDRNDEDWRKERQDPELFDKLKYTAPLLLVLSILFSIGYAVNGGWIWYLGCLLCLAAPVVLDIVLPAYFTLLPEKKGSKKNAWELEIPTFVHFVLGLVLPGRNWLDDDMFLVVMIVSGIGSALILGLLAEEFRRNRRSLWAVALVAGILGIFVAGHVNEAFDFSEPETYTLVVEDLAYSRSRRSSTYECTVTLPDGRQVELEISRSFYNELSVGDKVRVEHGVGALGIEYANAYPLE